MEAVTSRRNYECLLFDMDDTLYPLSLGLNLACRKNIEDYMRTYLHIKEDEVPRMCLELYREYGTTMAGLKAIGYDFDDDEFHAYVHGRLPYEKVNHDPLLRNLLLSMPQRKIVFTNADKAHAAQVLQRLGIEDCFEGVICFETLNPPQATSYSDEETSSSKAPTLTDHESDTSKQMGFFTESEAENDKLSDYANDPKTKARILCKPSIEAMETAIKIANVNPKKTIFFDDSPRNVAAAKAVGLSTVIVGSSALVPGADVALSSVHNIKEALPELWDGCDQSETDSILQSTAVETVITA